MKLQLLVFATFLRLLDCNDDAIGKNCSLENLPPPPTGLVWKLHSCPATVIFSPTFNCYLAINELCDEE